MNNSSPISLTRWIEILLATIGAFTCIVVPLLFAISELSLYDGQPGKLFPTPGLYFLEIALLGLIGFLSIIKPELSTSAIWRGMPWICAGVLMAFVILGAWSIGFALIPGMLSFLFTGILTDKRTKGDIALHFILFISGGLAQSSLVLLLLFFV